MIIHKHKIGEDTIYRLSESLSPPNAQLKNDNRIGKRKATTQVLNYFGMIDKVFKEPEPEEEPAKTKCGSSVASVIRRYALKLKEN